MPLSVRFDLPPREALEFFRRKGLKPTFAWQDMLREEHDAAFTVAKMLDLDLLSDVKELMDKAIAEGQLFKQFRESIEPMLFNKGWWGKQLMTDPLTGETKLVQLGSPRRLRVIYDTNLRTSYAVGHWAKIQANAKTQPFLMWDAVNDARTRPAHRAWDGLILPYDSPWFDTHWPPAGWLCRCKIIALSETDLRRMGKSGPDQTPPLDLQPWTNPRTGVTEMIPAGVDPAFAYNPGKSRLTHLKKALEEKSQAIKKKRVVRPKRKVTPKQPVSLRDLIKQVPFSQQEQAVIDYIEARRSASTQAIQLHGMPQAEQMYSVEWEDLTYYFAELTPKSPIVKTLLHFASVPDIAQEIERHTKQVIFTKQTNRDDPHWAIEYNEPGFVSAATGGQGTVTIYNNYSTGISTMAHEMGHNFAYGRYGSSSPRVQSDFRAAVSSGESPPTDYAKKAIAEDFAESVMLYHTDPDFLRQIAPKRFAVIDRMVKEKDYGG
jgi:SPP1 gp7 family putative phage head morphogenesis protein